jgi:hypothetical protein
MSVLNESIYIICFYSQVPPPHTNLNFQENTNIHLYVSILCVLYVYIFIEIFIQHTYFVFLYKIHRLHVSVTSTIFRPF